jgi:hypothetical protein
MTSRNLMKWAQQTPPETDDTQVVTAADGHNDHSRERFIYLFN